jgi:hypothetical protein
VAAAAAPHYGLLRYDALGTGQAALIAINLGAAGGSVQLDLSGLPPQLLGQRPRDLLCAGPPGPACPQPPALASRTSLAVSGYGVSALTGLRLPRWEPQGYLYNCSATYAPPPLAGEMPLAGCLIACLRDAKCDAVTVDWVQKHVWPRPASMAWYGNHVQCHLRGGLDLTRCEKDEAVLALHSTITMH